MTPETGYFLETARKLLGEAEAMLGINLFDAAGRTAYLAGFHAAQAFISEKTGRSVKTHKGVHMGLSRLARHEPNFDADLRGFLVHTYDLKAVADYETGPDSEISPERATAALQAAKRFVAYFEMLLATPSSEAGNAQNSAIP